jgi:hypothetical protein
MALFPIRVMISVQGNRTIAPIGAMNSLSDLNVQY